MGPGQDADQRDSPFDEQGAVDVPGGHRGGIQDSRRLKRGSRSRQVRAVLQRGAYLSNSLRRDLQTTRRKASAKPESEMPKLFRGKANFSYSSSPSSQQSSA